MIWLGRPLAVMGLLFAGATYLSQQVLIQHRLIWVMAAIATLVLGFAIALRLGLPAGLRAPVTDRMRQMTARFGGSRT
jgi:hypothetical protein